MRETYKITTTDGGKEFIGASSMSQALVAGKQIFPDATIHVTLASEEEINALFRAHSFDGIEADDFTGV